MIHKEDSTLHSEEQTEKEILLQATNIKKYFPIKGGVLRRTVGQLKAVDDISFHIYDGETLGVVGESGSGKATLGRVLLRLLPQTDGQIIFNSVNISSMSNREIRPFRKDMQIIFQDPFASLNSKMSVEELISEPLIIQNRLSKEERRKRVIEMLEKVGL